VRELLPEIWRSAQGSAELSMLQTTKKCALARTFIATTQQRDDVDFWRAQNARDASHIEPSSYFYFFGCRTPAT
jgi:hypothetical protein